MIFASISATATASQSIQCPTVPPTDCLNSSLLEQSELERANQALGDLHCASYCRHRAFESVALAMPPRRLLRLPCLPCHVSVWAEANPPIRHARDPIPLVHPSTLHCLLTVAAGERQQGHIGPREGSALP